MKYVLSCGSFFAGIALIAGGGVMIWMGTRDHDWKIGVGVGMVIVGVIASCAGGIRSCYIVNEEAGSMLSSHMARSPLPSVHLPSSSYGARRMDRVIDLEPSDYEKQKKREKADAENFRLNLQPWYHH